MKQILTIVLLFISASVFALTPKESCEFNGINYAAAQNFLAELKIAFAKNDKEHVAEMVSYPLRVNQYSNKQRRTTHYFIKSKKQFVAQYNTLFNMQKINSILNENEIFCNYQGAMLGGGVIWFDTTDNSGKIISINR